MEKSSSQECSFGNKSACFSTAEEPKAEEMQLHLLPADILRAILSRLSLNEVVRMTVLSHQWRRLRICHPDLVFTKDTFFASNTVQITNMASMDTEFVTKVDNVLQPLWSTSSTTTTTLNKFVVKFGLSQNHKDHIDRWISFSTASRAKHIAIDFTEGVNRGYICDKDMYVVLLSDLSGPNGSSVKHLHLGNVCLKLPPSFCGITNLKKLTLNRVSINSRDLECLLLSCALLESLSIEFCSLSSLSIHQDLSRLQDLRVRYCELKLIELHVSNLTKIDFDDNLKQIVLTGCYKLLEATFVSNRRRVPYNDYDMNFALTRHPTDIPHVHRLFLFLGLDQVVAFSENQNMFVNLKHLNMKLEIISYKWDTSWARGFVNLLKLAPLLEELELHVDRGIHYFLAMRIATAAQGPLHRHLKSVYMTGFCALFGLAELALYILGNATALTRMVVDPAAYGGYLNSDISLENEYHINEKRKFAEKNLDREEFRHILTIL